MKNLHFDDVKVLSTRNMVALALNKTLTQNQYKQFTKKGWMKRAKELQGLF